MKSVTLVEPNKKRNATFGTLPEGSGRKKTRSLSRQKRYSFTKRVGGRNRPKIIKKQLAKKPRPGRCWHNIGNQGENNHRNRRAKRPSLLTGGKKNSQKKKKKTSSQKIATTMKVGHLCCSVGSTGPLI